jgi:hypothetical protein
VVALLVGEKVVVQVGARLPAQHLHPGPPRVVAGRVVLLRLRCGSGGGGGGQRQAQCHEQGAQRPWHAGTNAVPGGSPRWGTRERDAAGVTCPRQTGCSFRPVFLVVQRFKMSERRAQGAPFPGLKNCTSLRVHNFRCALDRC